MDVPLETPPPYASICECFLRDHDLTWEESEQLLVFSEPSRRRGWKPITVWNVKTEVIPLVLVQHPCPWLWLFSGLLPQNLQKHLVLPISECPWDSAAQIGFFLPLLPEPESLWTLKF